jgi:hypothetical protein
MKKIQQSNYTTVKAIETTYNGYKFRSRLEARWAVFFDDLGIKYEYELEGFSLPSGGYLPDFYLPQFGIFVEVKPFENIPEPDLRKIIEFASTQDNPPLLIVGTPTNENMYLLEGTSWIDEMHELEGQAFEEFRKALFSELSCWCRVCFGFIPLSPYEVRLIYKSMPPYYHYLTYRALRAAKQARFEGGEQQ